MSFHYVIHDREQLMLMPVSMREWLPEDHLVWFVLDVVERIDTSAFHARHPNDGPGRPAYDPDMMLGLLFYAYCTGERSSYIIERLCQTDAAYRVLSSNLTPDQTTIARFFVNHETALEKTFVDILRLCAAAGLVSIDTIAIDGTKIGANAAKKANHRATFIEAQVAKIMDEVKQTAVHDDEHPELFESDLPAELTKPSERRKRLDAALEQIEKEEQDRKGEAKAKVEAARLAGSSGRNLTGKKPTEPGAALARAEIEVSVLQKRFDDQLAAWNEHKSKKAAQGKPMTGRTPKPNKHLRKAIKRLEVARTAVENAPEPSAIKANITDPDSRIMKTKDGFIQGYNAQAAVNGQHIIVASSLTQEGNDCLQYQPMVTKALTMLQAAEVAGPIAVVLADAGYWTEENATATGPNRLIATLKDHKQRTAARLLGNTHGEPPAEASLSKAMEHRLRTPQGSALYSQRSHTVEPVFGNQKENKNFRRFRRRGLKAVTSEWSLMNTAHNLCKLFDHQQGIQPALS